MTDHTATEIAARYGLTLDDLLMAQREQGSITRHVSYSANYLAGAVAGDVSREPTHHLRGPLAVFALSQLSDAEFAALAALNDGDAAA